MLNMALSHESLRTNQKQNNHDDPAILLLNTYQNKLKAASQEKLSMSYIIKQDWLKIQTKESAGEMAQQLEGLAALPGFLGSVPVTHMEAHSHL